MPLKSLKMQLFLSSVFNMLCNSLPIPQIQLPVVRGHRHQVSRLQGHPEDEQVGPLAVHVIVLLVREVVDAGEDRIRDEGGRGREPAHEVPDQVGQEPELRDLQLANFEVNYNFLCRFLTILFT